MCSAEDMREVTGTISLITISNIIFFYDHLYCWQNCAYCEIQRNQTLPLRRQLQEMTVWFSCSTMCYGGRLIRLQTHNKRIAVMGPRFTKLNPIVVRHAEDNNKLVLWDWMGR